MVVSSVALKVLVPVLIAGGGVVAVVTAPDRVDAVQAAQLWIDSPTDGAQVAPGPVTVVAHAADGLALDALTLEVDGEQVASRSDLTSYDRLAGVQLSWNATDGAHLLVVRGGDLASAPVAVFVGEPGVIATPTAAPTPSASATPTPSATPTATATASATPGRPTRTPSPTTAPTTAAPPADPTVLSVTVNPSSIGGSSCTGTVTVTAKVKNATGGSAQVTGDYGVDRNIGGSVKNGVFTATFVQNRLADPDPGYETKNVSGDFRVEVTVTNATGFDVGVATFQVSCAKD